MGEQTRGRRVHERWAHFRFSVIGQLLAAPPGKGELAAAIVELAERTWRHPTGESTRFGFSTIIPPPRPQVLRSPYLSRMTALLRHRPRVSATIQLDTGERVAISIGPSGIVISKLWLSRLRRLLIKWPRSNPKLLDRATVFFMCGPASDLPGDTVLELMVTRFMRECHSLADVIRLCEQVK
jgi:hypothetical protein